MDAKFTIMDIAQALVRRSNVSYNEATTFVRLFFETIQEGLVRERIVKVRGFGTFKVIGVEARESVSIVDGSRIQIAGHTKVSFTPDAVLRDAVNKPFAEFDTVVLNDELDLEELNSLDLSASPLPPSKIENIPSSEDIPITEESPSVEESR